MSKFVHNVFDLKIGKLYQNPRKKRVDLYQNSHVWSDAFVLPHIIGYVDPEDWFVLLETKLLHNTYYCLKIISCKGQVGWSGELHIDPKKYKSMVFEELT